MWKIGDKVQGTISFEGVQYRAVPFGNYYRSVPFGEVVGVDDDGWTYVLYEGARIGMPAEDWVAGDVELPVMTELILARFDADIQRRMEAAIDVLVKKYGLSP